MGIETSGPGTRAGAPTSPCKSRLPRVGIETLGRDHLHQQPALLPVKAGFPEWGLKQSLPPPATPWCRGPVKAGFPEWGLKRCESWRKRAAVRSCKSRLPRVGIETRVHLLPRAWPPGPVKAGFPEWGLKQAPAGAAPAECPRSCKSRLPRVGIETPEFAAVRGASPSPGNGSLRPRTQGCLTRPCVWHRGPRVT